MSRPSEVLAQLVSKRVLALATMLGRPQSAEARVIWINALKFLMPQQIEAGFDRLESGFIPTAACPFPVPAHLLGVVADAEKNREKLDADRAWDDVLVWIERYYHPDLPNGKTNGTGKCPLMQEDFVKPVTAAGGLEHIYSCPIDQLVWAKNRFVDAYLGLAKLEQDKPLLGSADVVKQIPELAERKALK